MQSIFKYGKIQSTSLTPKKEQKLLIYGTPSYMWGREVINYLYLKVN